MTITERERETFRERQNIVRMRETVKERQNIMRERERDRT